MHTIRICLVVGDIDVWVGLYANSMVCNEEGAIVCGHFQSSHACARYPWRFFIT